jgi:hypothetical protein
MDFSQALKYPFDDPDGIKKLAIAVGITLVGIIPVIGWIAVGLLFAGWSYEITKRVRNGDPTPLPEWSDFGALISRGLQLAIGWIVYNLPGLLFLCIGVSAVLLPAFGVIDEDMAGIGTALTACCSCLYVLYSIAAGLVYWGGYMRYLDDEQLGTFFQFGDNIALVRNNIGDFGMALVFTILGGLIGGILAGTMIGGLVAPTFQTYFNAHILGQLATKLRAGGAAAVPQV